MIAKKNQPSYSKYHLSERFFFGFNHETRAVRFPIIESNSKIRESHLQKTLPIMKNTHRKTSKKLKGDPLEKKIRMSLNAEKN